MVILPSLTAACLLTEMVRFSTSRSDQSKATSSPSQFQKEHGQHFPFLCGFQICADALCWQDFHFLLFDLWDDAILCGITENEPFLDSPVKGIVQHHVDAPDCGVAQSGILFSLHFTESAVLQQVFVHLLDIP